MARKWLLRAWLLLTLITLNACARAEQETVEGEPAQRLTDIPAALEDVLTDFLLFLPKILAALVMFVLALYVANLVSAVVRRVMKRRGAEPGITLLFSLVARWSIIILGTIGALRQVDFELTAFLAGLGILGFTVGFALQDISQNVVAGLLLLIQKPFELGDLINVGDYTGKVLSVDLRSTELYTRNGHNVLIPNAHVFTTPITNYNRSHTWRINLTIGVAYDSNLEKVYQTTLEAVRALPDVLDEPSPDFYYHTFNDSSIDFTVRYWIDSRAINPFTATHPAVMAIQEAYDAAGIEIPYPIQTEIQVTK